MARAARKTESGAPLFPPEKVFEALEEVYSKGIQVFCHANGDAAIDMIIEGAELAGVKASQDRRTVIIHSQVMRPDQIEKYVELGFSPSFFTMHTFFWGSEHEANLGKQRASFISPMQTAIDAGLICSSHTDFSGLPYGPHSVMWSSNTTTTGRRSGYRPGRPSSTR
ncbi:MAG: amidohydrolase family protein [Caldilineaceae bacterium]